MWCSSEPTHSHDVGLEWLCELIDLHVCIYCRINQCCLHSFLVCDKKAYHLQIEFQGLNFMKNYFIVCFVFLALSACTKGADKKSNNEVGQSNNVESTASKNPEVICKSSKLLALKASEPYLMNLMKGSRGMSVPGYAEAEAAVKSVALACGVEKYSVNELLDEAELTNSGFVLK